MNNEDIIKQIRNSVEKQISEGQMTPEVVFIFLQLQILDKLDLANNNLICGFSELCSLTNHKTVQWFKVRWPGEWYEAFWALPLSLTKLFQATRARLGNLKQAVFLT